MQCVPNLRSLYIRSDQLYRDELRTSLLPDQHLIYHPSSLNRFMHSPTSILRQCRLRNLRTFHFEISIANNVNLCAFLNKHPSLTDISLGHISGYYGHIDSETYPVVLNLPNLKRFSAPDYYFYCLSKPVPSLVVAEVWMAPNPEGAMLTLVKQHLKHLSRRRVGRDGESVIVAEPALDYIAGIAPSVRDLAVRHRPGFPGSTIYFSRPGIQVSTIGCILYALGEPN